MQNTKTRRSRVFDYNELERISKTVTTMTEFCQMADIKPGSLSYLMERDERLRKIYYAGEEHRRTNRIERIDQLKKQRAEFINPTAFQTTSAERLPQAADIERVSEFIPDDVQRTVLNIVEKGRRSLAQLAAEPELSGVGKVKLYIAVSELIVRKKIEKSYFHELPVYNAVKGGRRQ